MALPRRRLGLRQCEPEIYPAPQFIEKLVLENPRRALQSRRKNSNKKKKTAPARLRPPAVQPREPSKHKEVREEDLTALTAPLPRCGTAPRPTFLPQAA